MSGTNIPQQEKTFTERLRETVLKQCAPAVFHDGCFGTGSRNGKPTEINGCFGKITLPAPTEINGCFGKITLPAPTESKPASPKPFPFWKSCQP